MTAADDSVLAGTSITIPAGALTTDTTISIGLSEQDVAPKGTTAAGPVVDFEPSGTVFAKPVTMTIPVTASHSLYIEAVEADGSTSVIAVKSVSDGIATFQVKGFTSFGAWTGTSTVDASVTCASNADCASGETCTDGVCGGIFHVRRRRLRERRDLLVVPGGLRQLHDDGRRGCRLHYRRGLHWRERLHQRRLRVELRRRGRGRRGLRQPVARREHRLRRGRRRAGVRGGGDALRKRLHRCLVRPGQLRRLRDGVPDGADLLRRGLHDLKRRKRQRAPRPSPGALLPLLEQVAERPERGPGGALAADLLELRPLLGVLRGLDREA